MARSRGDSFGYGRPPRYATFERPLPQARGTYAKGKRRGSQGEAQAPDLLAKWDKDQNWRSWRKGMTLAYNQLLTDRSAFAPASVLRLPAFQPQLLWQAAPALLVAFPSKSSPEGRWTVAVKPRGTDITAQPLAADAQSEISLSGADLTRRLLRVRVVDAWAPSLLQAASSLIGELVEDTGVSATEVVDDDEATILMCVAVYPEQGELVFDLERYWIRSVLDSGRRVLRQVDVAANEATPRFRAGRHLVQSTTLSCNCPQFLGREFLNLRPDQQLGSQGWFPQRSGSAELPQERLLDELTLVLGGETLAPIPDDPLEGVARRFFPLNWQRLPSEGCKHCHAVRFALGVPVEEPSDYVSLASDYWLSAGGMDQLEEMRAPLASESFVSSLQSVWQEDSAFSRLDTTMTTAVVGDAFSVVPDQIRLVSSQIGFQVESGPSSRDRFNQQFFRTEPESAEEAVLGDVWCGRGTAANSRPYLGPGEVLDEPYVQEQVSETPPLLP